MIYKRLLPTKRTLLLKKTACDKEEIKRRSMFKTSFPRLLQVCSTIRDEAAPIFYATNVWKITDVPEGLQLPSVFKKHVHKAIVAFDRRIFSIQEIWRISDEVFEEGSLARRRCTDIHVELKRELLEIWQEKCEVLTSLPNLRELTVDFENCRCPIGCCRMVEDVFDELAGCVTLEDDRKIDVTGLVFEHEAEMIHRENFRCEDCATEPEDEYDEDSEDGSQVMSDFEDEEKPLVCNRSLPDEEL